MDDTELDRALKSALSVSPSPEFLPRVRQRIAESHPAPLFGTWLKVAALSAAGIVIVSAIALNSRITETTPALPRLHSRAIAGFTEQPSVPRSALLGVSASSEVSIASDLQPRSLRASSLPEVLVDRDQVRVIHDLFVAARERRFEVIFSDRPPSEPLMTTDLAVAPLEIVPLNPLVDVNN